MAYKIKSKSVRVGVIKNRFENKNIYRVVALYEDKKGNTKDLCKDDPWTDDKKEAIFYKERFYESVPKNIKAKKINKILDVSK